MWQDTKLNVNPIFFFIADNKTGLNQELVLQECEKEKSHAKQMRDFYTHRLKEDKV